MKPKAATAGMAEAFITRMKNDLFFHFKMKIRLIFSFFTRNHLWEGNCIVLWE